MVGGWKGGNEGGRREGGGERWEVGGWRRGGKKVRGSEGMRKG